MKVICIAKLHLAADFFQINRRKAAFYCGRSTHIHEAWGFDGAMDCGELACACFVLMCNCF